MEMSLGNVSLANPSVLKRSASTASLPTPPRTYKKCKSGCSRGDCDSESDDLKNQDSVLSSTDEEDAHFQRSRKKRRRNISKGDDEEEAFWLAGPKSEPQSQRDLHQEYLSDIDKEEGADVVDLSSAAAPLLYRKPMKQSHSEASSGLTSPPPSNRKPPLQPLATSPVDVPEPSATAAPPIMQPVSPPKTPRKRTGLRRGLKLPEFPIISDSPDNPFYVAPGPPSPGEESESPHVDSVSPRTPGTTHYEKPTVTYVFRGVRREYQNPLYNHKENRPLSPPPTSLLPIEHPDYSPDMTCRPTILFPNAPKGKYSVCAKEESLVDASTSKDLRRSRRKTRVVIGDSDDENDLQRRSEEAERKVLITPRKLDFGPSKKAKAVDDKADTL